MPKKKILLALSEDLLGRLDGFCEEAGVSRASYISILLATNLPPSAKSHSRCKEDAADRNAAQPGPAAEDSFAERLGIDLSEWTG